MDTRLEVQRCLAELGLQSYSSVDLMIFTSNFLESNKIGSGGYGEVYKGQLPKGVLIAVKVLENMDVVEDTFMAEVSTMGKARHRNLIKLYGYCFEDDVKALVYEYMDNGSLDKILYENNHGGIEWVKLYGIANDIANGLNYLHDGLEEQIIHYDIKAANVLLGKNFSAKLTDFGLAKIMNRDISPFEVSAIRGTNGYIAPEIWTPGSQVSCKCDVYSFGMMLFEILGKRSNGKEKDWFPIIVWKQFENGTLDQLIRDCGITEKDRGKAIILSKVALCCAHHIPEQRPSMMEVVLMFKENMPVWKPSYPFVLIQSYKSSMVPSQEGFHQVFLETQLAISKREKVDTFVPNKGMKLPTTRLVGKTTALKYKEIVLQWIAKDEIATIGIHGMGGAGKTTLFKHVHNTLLEEGKHFDKIIWVTVPKDVNIIKLQNDLGKELDLDLSFENDEDRKSRLLFQALEKRKRVVFFFDDMWREISLEKIGIPIPTKENGFKLILTTRLLDVCRKMKCDKDNTITIERLPEDEAWELFMDKIDCVLSPEVEKIAKMVAKKCLGLPLAIITVGGAMTRNSDIDEWTVALDDLNLDDPSNRTMNIEDNVFECLKFSYDRLENEKQRKCFLCCVLYPEDWEIETWDLVDFWIMDGLIEGTNRQNELVKGQYIFNKLKDHCLLETVDKVYDQYRDLSNGVKFHDLVREMALRLTNKSFLVKGQGLKELPNEEEWEIHLERASFMNNEIKAISISPKCPKLSTLILRGRGFLESVTPDFFVHMKCLRVLDMRSDVVFGNHDLDLLPDSISNLVNLRALRLNSYSELKKLPSLAKLVLLRRLELENSGVEELPKGMEMLVNLRRLNLRGVKLKEKIPIGLISNFPLLQELYLGGIKVDKLYEVGRGESFAKELLSLRKLENLSVTFRYLSDYCSYVGSPKFKELNCFHLAIGKKNPIYRYLGPTPRESLISISDPADQHISLVFPKNTKQVEIRECNKIECIRIHVYCLKKLTISGCDNLKNVFPSSRWLQLFKNLEEIKIGSCNELEVLIGDDEEEETEKRPIAIPKLKYLEIWDLPKLKRICRGVIICKSLECVSVEDCLELKRLPQFVGAEQSSTPPALSSIRGSREWWDSLEWDPAYPKNILEPFFREREKPEYIPPPSFKTILATREWWDPNYTKNIPLFRGRGIELGKGFSLHPTSPMPWCDNCEIWLRGKWYKCKDCWEKQVAYPGGIGFDLCEECYNTPSKHSDYVNQHHTKGHTLEIQGEDSSMSVGEKSSQPDYVIQHHTKGHTLEPHGEHSSMSEGEKSSQSDKCAPEGADYCAGINREEREMVDRLLSMSASCNNCKICPIYGKRYICKDCFVENVSALCEECYNTPAKHSIHVNQHNTQEHTIFMLIVAPGDSSVPVHPDAYWGTEESQIQYALELSLGIQPTINREATPLETATPTDCRTKVSKQFQFNSQLTEESQLQYALELSLGAQPTMNREATPLETATPTDCPTQTQASKQFQFNSQRTEESQIQYALELSLGVQPTINREATPLETATPTDCQTQVSKQFQFNSQLTEESLLQYALELSLGVQPTMNREATPLETATPTDCQTQVSKQFQFNSQRTEESQIQYALELSHGIQPTMNREATPLETATPTDCQTQMLKPNKEEHKKRNNLEPVGSMLEKRIEPTRHIQSSIDSFEETLHLIFPDKDAQIKFPIGIEIFGEDIEFSYLPKADILDVVHMNDLEAIILMIYMRCLYEKCQSTRDRFQFINPVSFQAAQGKDKAKYFREQLEKANGREIVLLPYNTGGHWVLFVFDLVHMDFYWLDSLHGEPTEELKLFFEGCLIAYKIRQGSRKFSPKWHSIKGPRQPFISLQCGYYVMKFITELMEESLLSIETKMKVLVGKNFTEEDIDEVRLVIIAFVQRCIGKYGVEKLDV